MTAPLPAPGGSLILLREKAKFGSAVYFDLRAWGRKQQGLTVVGAGLATAVASQHSPTKLVIAGAKVEGGESGRA